jgi:REP element-mobilizing transposase RayT
LPTYDYSDPGGYFVTMCAHQRKCIFGDIVNGEMRLSDPGRVVADCWRAIPSHFAAVELDEFVIMPNHLLRHNA